jgi:hypothetical protein
MSTIEVREQLKSEGISAIVRLVDNRFEIKVKKAEHFVKTVKMFPLANVSHTTIK